MSILKQIETKTLTEAKRTVKMNKGIAHAATVLAESSLGARCPNLVKGLESESKEAKYAAATLVQLIENTANYVREADGKDILKEDVNTTATSLLSPGVASLTPQLVDIVNVFYPMMVANYIADIQALDRQSGQIFTIKTRYVEEAAGVKAGDIVFEKATDGTYSSEGVIAYAEKDIAAEVTMTTTLADDATVKVRAGSFIVRMNGKEIARDYGMDTKLDGVGGTYVVIGKGVSGTVNAVTGEAALKFDMAMFDADAKVTAEASYDTETDEDLIRKVQFDIPNQPILAKEHPLMSSYSVAAGLVMNAHLAIDTDELISNQLAGTIRWERDLALIKAVSAAAKAPAGTPNALTFDCAANGENLTLQQRYSSYTTVISTARGLIQEAAGRGTVDFIIVSAQQGLPVVEQIDGFKAAPEAKKPVGPYLAGTLREGTINVIAVPYSTTLPADQVIFGFKGFQLGDSAIVLAEWVPLYFTPTFQAPNLRNHKGALSFYDLFVNKAEYLVKGTIANFNQQ
jgi:hypothetical protein